MIFSSLSLLVLFFNTFIGEGFWCLQVAGIFHDASIGNAIHVMLVRLILLQGEEVTLSPRSWGPDFFL